jgi:hypothetical protein
LSERDLETSMIEASQRALLFLGKGEKNTDARDADTLFNDHLMTEIVSRTISDPNDVAKVHQCLPLPQDMVREYMTPAGVQLVFHAYERLVLETSPISHEIEDEEVPLLVAHLVQASLAKLPLARAKSARRLLGYVLAEFGQVAPGVEASDVDIDGSEEEEEPAGYTIRVREETVTE